LFTARKLTGARFSFWMIALTNRAMRSAPPPVPAGMMNSTGFVGCHAAALLRGTNTAAARRTKNLPIQPRCLMVSSQMCSAGRVRPTV